VNTALLWKSVAAAGAMIILFFMGLPVSKVAVVTGAILLITRRIKPEKVYREIDWSLSILTDPQHAWLTLAMSSTLAGNLTVLGSIANLIVIERSRRSIKISFIEYLKVGVPLTLLTLWIGVLILN
jgi:Na+/H+ antiporter NhaD/arsenite permease-like protein